MTGTVAVVVVSHDTRDDAVACMATVLAAGATQAVLVDSGSTDGTPAAVEAAHPDVDVVRLANVGYGSAANAGVARTTTEHVVIANADTRFDADALERLAAALDADPEIGAVGPRVVYPDGRPQASARRFPSLPEAAGHALLGLWMPNNRWTRSYRMVDADPDAARDVDWLSGCAVAIRRSAFDEVNGFDPGYFMYVEDVDLGHRLSAAGWRIRYDPSARVVHSVGASTGNRPTKMVVEHARSLDRFFGRVSADEPTRFLRPLVRAGLGLWVALVVVWNRLVRGGRSSTGE